jgi:hypothetical protein
VAAYAIKETIAAFQFSAKFAPTFFDGNLKPSTN